MTLNYLIRLSSCLRHKLFKILNSNFLPLLTLDFYCSTTPLDIIPRYGRLVNQDVLYTFIKFKDLVYKEDRAKYRYYYVVRA